MQAKEFLESVLQAERELQLIEQKRRHYQEMATGLSSGFGSGVRNKSTSSKTENAAVCLADLVTELDVKASEYCGLIRKAEKLINSLRQPRFRQVLTLLYLCAHPPKTVQAEMSFRDEKSVYRCKGYALRELQKLL